MLEIERLRVSLACNKAANQSEKRNHDDTAGFHEYRSSTSNYRLTGGLPGVAQQQQMQGELRR
jgi:hypothetical protein